MSNSTMKNNPIVKAKVRTGNSINAIKRVMASIKKKVETVEQEDDFETQRSVCEQSTIYKPKRQQRYSLFEHTFRYLKSMNRVLTRELFDSLVSDLNEYYTKDSLNPQQRMIFDFIINNPTQHISLNAPPGTGKSYTLKTIATQCNPKMYSVVYKHDLVQSFMLLAVPKTAASFFMSLFDLKYSHYTALTNYLSVDVSPGYYLMMLIQLVRRAMVKEPLKYLYIIDECTVLPKLLLVSVIMYLKHYKCGLILCGDNNQLGAIHESSNSKQSTFELIKPLMDREFTLITNERCSDPEYNKVLRYFGSLSSEQKLYPIIQAFISIRFFRLLTSISDINDVHLGALYKYITDDIHSKYIELGVLKAPYFLIENSMVGTTEAYDTFKDSESVGKFIYYLPISKDLVYYYKSISETSKVKIIEIEKETLTIQSIYNEKDINIIGRSSIGKCIMDNHKEYLCKNRFGVLYNFPIYPANIMSSHMSQGCTIPKNVQINLYEATMKSVYVMFSRIMQESNITRINMPDAPNYMLSAILATDKLCDPSHQFTFDEAYNIIREFKYYTLNSELYKLLGEFCSTLNVDKRKNIRKIMQEKTENENFMMLEFLEEKPTFNYNKTLINIIKYKDIVLLLAHVPPQIAAIWIHEYSIANKDFTIFYHKNEVRDLGVCEPFLAVPYWYKIGETTLKYIERISEYDHLTDAVCNKYTNYQRFEFFKDVHKKCLENPDHDDLKGPLFSEEWLKEQLISFKKYLA